MATSSHDSQASITPIQHLKNFGNNLVKTTLFISIPIGIVYILNLPYPAIRRPVSEKAPLLLLPSQISTEYHFKKSVNLVEQSEQLIDNATSIDDILLGEQKLQEAKNSLNKIPLNFRSDLFGGHSGRYGYGWSYSPMDYQDMRGKVGNLEAKVFQEKNAQTLLQQAESALNQAKNDYQNKNNQEGAIAQWQQAINQLKEIPSTTFAGQKAEVKVNNYIAELEKIAGIQSNTDKFNTFIVSAQQFSAKAVQLGENPPHSLEKWTEIEGFWAMAIEELQQVSSEDGQGYIKARQLIAEYKGNLAEIKLRKTEEENALNSLNLAQDKIQILIQNPPTDINNGIAQIQDIINQLNKVKNGTTVYSEAQTLKSFAQNKLTEFNAKK
ncbi:hypothetical protein [Geminocystis herdmanii]|uniref:hypothetical protein n=1 Tax=Geminocystis herdmanii TaxID=669359 RepID=UPI000347382F|nr:hypothetical protein [Geminocystis herdmanii]